MSLGLSDNSSVGSGCCRAFLADKPLQHCVDIGDYAFVVADIYGGSSFQEGGPKDVFQLLGDHTPQLPWAGLFQGAGEYSLAASLTSGSRGVMWLSSLSWNTGPALYSPEGSGGDMGVAQPLHVFCGSGEYL